MAQKEQVFVFEMEPVLGWGSIKNISNGKLDSNDQFSISGPSLLEY